MRTRLVFKHAADTGLLPFARHDVLIAACAEADYVHDRLVDKFAGDGDLFCGRTGRFCSGLSRHLFHIKTVFDDGFRGAVPRNTNRTRMRSVIT